MSSNTYVYPALSSVRARFGAVITPLNLRLILKGLKSGVVKEQSVGNGISASSVT